MQGIPIYAFTNPLALFIFIHPALPIIESRKRVKIRGSIIAGGVNSFFTREFYHKHATCSVS